VPPPVVIEAVKTAEATVAHAAGVVRLQASQRDFEIAYTAMSFMAPENVRFKYRLEGFNDDWIEAVDRRTAFYTNVPPGEYRFQVIASNNDGVWNEAGASLALTVQSFFFETAWFRASMAGLALLLVGVGYRWRTSRLAARERELKAIVASRTHDLEQEKEATEKERVRADEQRRTAEHLRDLAEQARATVEAQAEKLKSLDETKSLFFANVSHEFRTPLTLTIGPLEDLISGLHGTPTRQMTEELDLALRNARRLLRLVNQILDIAKLEAGHMKLEAERADLTALLNNVALSFSSLAERGRVAFQIEIPAEPLWLYIDTDLQEKVFTNLLSNAFKFTPEGGTVRLEVDARRADGETGEVDIIVKDNGPGIAAEQVAHIFDRFYQADKSSLWQPGTGIGLSLAKELVELHGGHIKVETQEGFGSTFTVTLRCGRSHLKQGDIAGTKPARKREEPVAVEVEAGEASRNTSTSAPVTGDEDVTTVLVVDDNAEIRQYVRRHLEPVYRVTEAADGTEGLEAARRVLPDLVISDVMMPKMDGYALCDALKKDPDLDYIPVILLTARATTGEKIDGLELGADDYLTKPFDVNELRVRVANLVASRQRLREHFSRGGASLHAREVPVTSGADAFLERLREAVEAEMGDEEFSVDRLAEQMGLSRGHLHRRLRDLLDETPTHLIRRIRLERAMQLLAGRAGSVAYGVGFKSVSHFSQCFREQVGMTPSQYVAESASRMS
jgi:signal transduction histidine kinase/DNA-binding response OmpR family regulator